MDLETRGSMPLREVCTKRTHCFLKIPNHMAKTIAGYSWLGPMGFLSAGFQITTDTYTVIY